MVEEEREVGWVEVKNIVKKVVTHISIRQHYLFHSGKNRGWGQRK